MAEAGDVEFLAAAVGEAGMAWGHVQRCLLHCRRSGREEISDLVLKLDEIGKQLTTIEDTLRRVYRQTSR
jgi:hypothetical protein